MLTWLMMHYTVNGPLYWFATIGSVIEFGYAFY